ncbi:Photosystem II reaction center W protein [Cucumis melo var. makuwa]|uniref:PSII 6.1 kDa protein n=1 Tax=Cucumis melo var. makuwa TaxID=1194695 RepID=A0A5D3D4F6_CUCMM|nr:Photosystem II reaction center W protein [Cucumis melo var. makuwa]
MASTLLPHSRLLLKGSSKLLPSSTMAAPMAAVAMAALAAAGPAVALVDERMSTEGTGLPFGLSNNLLGWILAGMFGLIWALYFVYASSLDEDEDSGLSL